MNSILPSSLWTRSTSMSTPVQSRLYGLPKIESPSRTIQSSIRRGWWQCHLLQTVLLLQLRLLNQMMTVQPRKQRKKPKWRIQEKSCTTVGSSLTYCKRSRRSTSWKERSSPSTGSQCLDFSVLPGRRRRIQTTPEDPLVHLVSFFTLYWLAIHRWLRTTSTNYRWIRVSHDAEGGRNRKGRCKDRRRSIRLKGVQRNHSRSSVPEAKGCPHANDSNSREETQSPIFGTLLRHCVSIHHDEETHLTVSLLLCLSCFLSVVCGLSLAIDFERTLLFLELFRWSLTSVDCFWCVSVLFQNRKNIAHFLEDSFILPFLCYLC